MQNNNGQMGIFGSQPVNFNNGNSNMGNMFSINGNQPIIGNYQNVTDPYQAKAVFKTEKDIDLHIQ